MHRPITTPHESLYHDYVIHPHYHPNDDTRHDAPVTIVGAGPIGLCSALLLAKQGVKSIVLASQLQVCEGSRGLVYTKRSMQILQTAGVAKAIVQKALPWTAGNSFYHGKRVFRMQNPSDEHDVFAPLNNLQQNHLEKYLIDAALVNDYIEIRFGNHVTDLYSRADGVTLQVDTPVGTYSYKTPWLIAADGGRSFVRAKLDLKLHGSSYEGRFVIVDIKVDLPLPTERLAYFSPKWNQGNTILLHKEPDGMWRFDYQLSPEVSNEEALDPKNIAHAVNAQLAMMGYDDLPWELDWASVYSARALTLSDYVHGRICFVGDTAHLLPIFGVRGANTGFQDAMDLCWKLSSVILGFAGVDLLDSYSQERVRAAREIIDEAGKSTRFMAPPSKGFRLLRDAVLSLSLEHDFVRPLYHWRTSRPHRYDDSRLNAVGDDNALMHAELANGGVLPDVKLSEGSLYDVLDYQFAVLYFGQVPPTALQDEVATIAGQLPIKLISIHDDKADIVLDRSVIDERYHATTGEVYLIRPDHHIAGRWQSHVKGSLAAYFDKFHEMKGV